MKRDLFHKYFQYVQSIIGYNSGYNYLLQLLQRMGQGAATSTTSQKMCTMNNNMVVYKNQRKRGYNDTTIQMIQKLDNQKRGNILR